MQSLQVSKFKKIVWLSVMIPMLLSMSLFAEAVRIMPLGDSITAGTGGDSTTEIAYRGSLWSQLGDAGYDFDLVGSQSTGSSYDAAFDTDHEGHSGYKTTGIDDNIDAWLDDLGAKSPQIILLHIGTNDLTFPGYDVDVSTNNVKSILDKIYEHDPAIKILLARIITNGDIASSVTTTFNDSVVAMANDHAAEIDMVNMETGAGFNYLIGDDMHDTLHPNEVGYVKMANTWFSALETTGMLPPTEPTGGTLYEDAEDGQTDGWIVYDNTPVGAIISNVYDNDRASRVIQFSGGSTENGYKLGGSWNNTQGKILKWSMNYSEGFNIFIDVETDAGQRYITYIAADYDASWGATYPVFGLGSGVDNGQWHTFTRDLQADLTKAEPGVTLLAVNGFLIRGSGLVDDIELISDGETPDITPPVITVTGNNPETVVQDTAYTDAGAIALDDGDVPVVVITTGTVDTATLGDYTLTYTAKDAAGNIATATRTVSVVEAGQPSTGITYEDAEDGQTDGWIVFDNDPIGATITNVYDEDKNSQVIKLSGDKTNNGFLLGGVWGLGNKWNNTQAKTIQWRMKYDEYFDIYIVISTVKGNRYLQYNDKDSGSGIQEWSSEYIWLSLGSESNNGTWQTITRDLKADLARYEPDNELLAVNGIIFRGSGLIDDIELIQSSEGLNIDLPVEVSAPGVVFTFDDTHIDSWYPMRDTFKNNGVVATFFCSGWQYLSDSDVGKFRLLEEDGHEIASHTSEHRGIYDERYDNEPDKVNAYLIDQVIPNIENIQNSGFIPVSFAYPYTQYTPKYSAVIREYLPHIRQFFANVMGIDDFHNHGIDEIKNELQRIKDNKDIVVFIAHRILPESDTNPSPYRITPEKLMEIIDEAKRLGLKFYTLEEAHRIYVGQ